MTFRDAVLADSPLCYLECNETSGAVLADSSGHANAGAVIGTATLNQAGMSSRTGKAIAFDGSSRVNIGGLNGLLLSGDYTLELIARWSNFSTSPLFTLYDNSPTSMGPCVYWNAAQIDAPANALLFRSDFKSGYMTWYSSPLGDNTYRHCIFVRRGNVLEIWVNGELVSSAALPTVNVTTSANPAFIMSNGISQYSTGAVDEIAFYLSALTPARIKYHASLAANLGHVKGVAMLDNGLAASSVVARDWVTKKLIEQVVPAADGSFEIFTSATKCDVTVFGPAGYQPITHGPIDPVPLV